MAQRTPIAVLAKQLGMTARKLPWTMDALRHTTLAEIDRIRQEILTTSDELYAYVGASIPGAQIVDPETGRAFPVHDRWPKCRFNSDPVAKAAHNQRLTDPKVLAAIEKQTIIPSTCNCEWCVACQWDFGGSEYQAWLRAHQEARETWPESYWTALYPCQAHIVWPPKTEAEAFAA